jgi:hypothetical protein
MNKRQITRCPVCEGTLHISELACGACGTGLRGNFPLPPLARLAPEHQAFIETFIRSRGVIRDVERALSISYPTVRARLDAVVEALEEVIAEQAAAAAPPVPPPPPFSPSRDEHRREVLRQVEEGLLSPTEAAELLRSL